MPAHQLLGRNRYFEVLGTLMAENRSDDKVQLVNEIEMSSAERLRLRAQTHSGVKPSYTALVVKAAARALKACPYANRFIRDGLRRRMVQLYGTDISVAVARDEPGREMLAYAETIRDAGMKNLDQITRELQAQTAADPAYCQRWRGFQWIIEHLPTGVASALLSLPGRVPTLWVRHRGGALLVSSPAKYGVDLMSGSWPWPLGLSFGMVRERPVVYQGRVVAKPTMMLTLSFDRTLMAGAPAARFFRILSDGLEDAERLLEDAPEQTPAVPAGPLLAQPMQV